MSRRAQIEALLERVRAAKGKDYEIDRSVSEMFGKKNDFGVLIVAGRWIGIAAFTSSLDAVVALIERELPGWQWTVTGGIGVAAELSSNDGQFLVQGEKEVHATAPTTPLALLSAFLIAYLQTLPEEA